MLVLAIDTSLEAVSVCVFNSASLTIEAEELISLKRGHAEALMPLLESLGNGISGGLAALDRIAVTVGPGSFTGIRVGVSAARGLGLALGIPVVGVSTLAAFAAPLVLRRAGSKIVSAIDARHGHVYLQMFSPAGKTIFAPRLIDAREGAVKIGEGPFRMTGTAGSLMTIEAWALLQQADPDGDLSLPRIDFVARIGVSADPATAPPIPLYLKNVDAEPMAARQTQYV